MTLEEKIMIFRREIPLILKEFSEKIYLAFKGGIGAEMDSGEKILPENRTWSELPALRILRSGGENTSLWDSFDEGNPDSLTKTVIARTGVEMVIGSKRKYAQIQEYGGFVRSKGHMAGWFMYMSRVYPANIFYRVMIGSVIKRGGVMIPARPYWKKGLKAGERNFMIITHNLIARLVNLFE